MQPPHVLEVVETLYWSDENAVPLEQLVQAAKQVEEWWHRAQVDGILSSNEEWDDIPTNQTVVLLFPFLLGMAKVSSNEDWEQRKQKIEQAISYFLSFLQTLTHLRFLSPYDQTQANWAIQWLQGGEEEKDHSSESEKRRRKIELFKQQKQWKQRVDHLSEWVHRCEPVDEELQREWVKSKLCLAVYKVIGMAQHLVEELRLLEYAKYKETEEQGSQPSVSHNNSQPVLIKLGRMRFYEPIVKQPPPFRIPQDDPCFPLHHHHEQPPPPPRKTNQEEDPDAEIYKQRKWDDWKDDHNRGSGNTLR